VRFLDYIPLVLPWAGVSLIVWLTRRNGEWHGTGDGSMRRFKDGKFETRLLTGDELKAWQREQW
jgi:hypothetical protein